MASTQTALGPLLLAAVRPAAEPLLRRALGWARDLERLGVDVPLPLAHDLGLVLSTPTTQIDIAPRRGAAQALANSPGAAKMHEAYVEAIQSLSTDDTVERVRALRPSDDLVVVLLTRLLSREGKARTVDRAIETCDLTHLSDLDRRLPSLFTEVQRDADIEGLARFLRELQRLRVVLDTIDLDTIRLLAVVGQNPGGDSVPAMGAVSGIAQVELLAALNSLQANDVVNFSLELLPAVLETKRRSAPGTWATGGYQGLTRRGSLDSLVLTELAWDDEELARRIVDDEVLYHARERSEDEAARVHLVLVDASASMRGDRTTFARGVAIALAKRLELEGEEARIRFFDRRLYEPFGGASAPGGGARRGALAAAIPHVLAFRGEKGRSPERVLRQLAGELDVLRARDRRSPVVHLVTHAAFYAPRSLVGEVRSRAALFAVFIAPHRNEEKKEAEIDVDFLDLLDGYWTIDQATLAKSDDRARRGKEIVQAIPKSAGDAPDLDPSPTSRGDLPPPSSRTAASAGAPSRRPTP
jgi:hypothetical protein